MLIIDISIILDHLLTNRIDLYRVILKAKGTFTVEWKVAFTELLMTVETVQQEDLCDYWHSGVSSTVSVTVKFSDASSKFYQQAAFWSTP